jgi:hypothetical protein
MKVPPGYHRHFQSFDGAARKLVVEGAGGPSWFTEYNVLTGLSALYGRFAHRRRVLPLVGARPAEHAQPLRLQDFQPLSILRCVSWFARLPDYDGHRALSRYEGTRARTEPDSFYFSQATNIIARERGQARCFCSFIPPPIISRGLQLPSGIDPGRALGNARASMNTFGDRP